jgi:hypothetical protein
MVEMIESNNPNMNAHKNPSILIPDTNLSASKMMRTFITRRNRPSVIIVRGNVRMISRGFTIAFRIPSTKANIIAVVKDLITTWGSKSLESIYTATAVISKLIKNRIIVIFMEANF